MYEPQLEFLEWWGVGGGRGSNQKTLHGESMDIFWNNTLVFLMSYAAWPIVYYLFFLFCFRDKHGKPMSHPDYDPRTLLVIDT